MTIYSIHKRFGASLRGLLGLCGIATLGAGGLLSGTVYGQTAAGYGFPSTAMQTAGGAMSYGGDTYQVVNAGSAEAAGASNTSRVMQAAGLASNSMLARGRAVAPVSYSEGCSQCGSPTCNGNCGGGYANGGLAAGGFNGMGYQPRFGSGEPTACGTPCNPYRYGSIEALYMQRRGDEHSSLSPNMNLDGFDYAWAPRITIGSVPDCQRGYEFSYFGNFNWNQNASIVAGPGQRIRTSLVDSLGVDSGNLNAFVNNPGVTAVTAQPATTTTTTVGGTTTVSTTPAVMGVTGIPATYSVAQSQSYKSRLSSFDASRTLIGYDLVKVLYGFRYINLNENLGYSSRNNAGDTGALLSNVQNRLFGVQIGMNGLYPISCHGFVDFRGRAGAFLDFAESNVSLFNNGAAVLANSDRDSQLAGFFELGSGVRYQLGEALSVRAGGELWYLSGVATAPGQISRNVTSNIGNRVNLNDDVFLVGFSAGAEYKW